MIRNLREIYQFHISLLDMKPPIWRRFIVLNITLLDDFHQILQIVMGWDDYHLHEFTIGNGKTAKSYGIPDDEFGDMDTLDESKFRLCDIMKKEGSTMKYVYDFGDYWVHVLKLEKIFPFEIGQQLPFCVKGRRACPIENVGGALGYNNFLAAYMDNKHPAHQEMKEWASKGFHPNHFDIEKVNEDLASDYKI